MKAPKVSKTTMERLTGVVAAAGRKAKGLKTTAAGVVVILLGGYAAYLGHDTGIPAVLVGLGLVFGVGGEPEAPTGS